MSAEGQSKKDSNQKTGSLQVYNFLVDTFPHEYNAPTLAKVLGLPRNNVKVYLMRLCKKGKAKRTTRGFYRAVLKRDLAYRLGDPEVKYHGILLHSRVTKPIHGINSVTIEKLLSLGFVAKSNRRLVARLDWEGRWVTVVVHSGTGLVQAYVRSSDSPLDGLELVMLEAFVGGFLRPVFSWLRWERRQIGVNRDFENVRLEGGGCVSRRVGSNATARVYEHRGRGVRAEIHLDLREAKVLLDGLSERPGGVWLPSGLGDRERLVMDCVLGMVAGGGVGGVAFSVLWDELGLACQNEAELVGFVDLLKHEGLIFEPVDGVYRSV